MREVTMRYLLERSWTRFTSADIENWTPSRPSTGQCAVSALIVQEHMGGRIMRAPLRGGGSHYWNVLADGRELDVTADQFDNATPPISDEPEERTSYDLLANEHTAARWRLLRDRFQTALLRLTDSVLVGEQSDDSKGAR